MRQEEFLKKDYRDKARKSREKSTESLRDGVGWDGVGWGQIEESCVVKHRITRDTETATLVFKVLNHAIIKASFAAMCPYLYDSVCI